MTVRLIAVDLDETLLQSDRTICAGGAARLREAQEKGICVVIATARSLQSVREISTEVGLIHQPVICADGALIMSHPFGEVWQEQVISSETASKIADYADTNDWELMMIVQNITCYRQRPGQALGRLNDNLFVVKSNTAMLDRGQPTRILVYDSDAIRGIVPFLDDQDNTTQIRVQYYYEPDGRIRSLGIYPQLASKGNALTYICNRLGIPLEQTMAIGDSVNDISMLKVAGISVAMGNAPEDVKQLADFITASNNAYGVAKAIEKYVL